MIKLILLPERAIPVSFESLSTLLLGSLSVTLQITRTLKVTQRDMLDLKDPVVYEHHSNRHSADPTLGNMQFSLAQQFFRHDLRLYFYICFSALKWLQGTTYAYSKP
ncbi:uncharacterized protein AKAW2_21552A [Aspergillus luchuensis]|uniref:Uncharacterized protein n=1 Tax=Aspergillus kawachii TaxID=1069201 RepID=A0A7R7W584_ASPKA|nr:uncharacterized protein AKAW2_21552A [Aspergillus luchuensis]BCR96612.1 hypothetical protein AKAW2_21552A [Aspergillus luchuensis]